MIIKRPIGEKGQVVIPKDIRTMLGVQRGGQIIFEIKDNEVTIRKENPAKFLESFLDVPRPKKNLTLKDLRKLEDESYDLP